MVMDKDEGHMLGVMTRFNASGSPSKPRCMRLPAWCMTATALTMSISAPMKTTSSEVVFKLGTHSHTALC